MVDIAVADLLKQLDKNNNRVITQSEIDGLTVKVLGYSWGGISAVAICKRLSQTGFIRTGGTPKNPIGYDLTVPIPISALVTIDPVQTLNPAGTVPSTVSNFVNYYQMIGGYAIFRNTDSNSIDTNIEAPPSPFGNWFSALLKGSSITSQASNPAIQVRVEMDMTNTSVPGIPFPGIYGPLYLFGGEVNHDVMPWYAAPYVSSWLQ